VDARFVGRQGGGAENRSTRQQQHDPKKNVLKPSLKDQWVIPPDGNAGFVAAMEDVLDVYRRPPDSDRPAVCLDETTKQLIKVTRVPIPAKPGATGQNLLRIRAERTADIFMLFAPLEGWRHVEVTDRHAAIDYAHLLRDLSDQWFADAAKIVLV
jgi:hypothetical protein